MSIYGYVRVSTRKQKLDRQITNITSAYPSAIIKSEFYTGTTTIRPEWEKLKKMLRNEDTVVLIA